MFRAPATAGELLQVFRQESSSTRAELVARTRLSRVALGQRLAALVEHGLVMPDGQERSTGGRPPVQFRFNPGAGLVLGVDVGITASRVALADLEGDVVADLAERMSVEDGPEAVLGWVGRQADALLARMGRARSALWGAGVGVPGPVEFEQGRVVSPPFMRGWDRYPIRQWFVERFGCPAVVDKDANIMALGEHQRSWRHLRDILFVKAGTGIGCGIIAGGQIYRGARGAAGDIGHIQVRGEDGPLCRCGNLGCVEAMAGGWALIRDLRAEGVDVETASDVARLARAADPRAVAAVRMAGRVLGEALADAVNLLNPSLIVLGGAIGQGHGELLAGLREVIYHRSLALATTDLQIVPSSLGERAGVVGAARLVAAQVLTPAAIDNRLARAS